MKHVVLRFMACSDLHYSDDPGCRERKRFEEGLRQLYAYADTQPYRSVDAVYIVGDFATSGTMEQMKMVKDSLDRGLRPETLVNLCLASHEYHGPEGEAGARRRFDEVFGQGGAVQRDERFVLASGKFHDGMGEQFLAGAAGAADQHGGVSRSYLAEFGIDLLHFAAVADQFSRRVLQHVAQFSVFFEQGLLFLMQQQTFGCGIGGDAGKDLQKSRVAFEIGVRRDQTVVMEQRDADERRGSVVMVGARAVEEPRIAAEIGDHMAAAGLGDMAGDAFAEIIEPFFLFRLGQTVGSFDLERVAVTERKSAAAHTHFAVDDLKHFFQHGFDIASMNQHRTDFLYHQNLRMNLCFHNGCNIHAFHAVIKREKK